jgi:alkylation response protein AidB-like acyl-CoA dehydrogenase
VDFAFSDEQMALRDLARDLFEKESPPSRLRALWEGAPWDRRVWETMAKAGLTGLTVPEEHGGAGGNELDLILVLEEAGRAALPEPILETVGIAAPLIAEAGTEKQQHEWLPRIAAGTAIVTIGGPLVPYADTADVLLHSKSTSSETRAYAVPSGRFRARKIETQDRAIPVFLVDDVNVRGTRIPAGIEPLERAFGRLVLAAASMLNGVALKLLELSVEHAKTRRQFGHPIGSFQAVKHQLADVYVALECARSATWYAAWAMASLAPDAKDAISAAKATASDAEALANRVALQVHGGIGFTWEHDLHFWLTRGKALEQTWGSAAGHRAGVARSRFGSVS